MQNLISSVIVSLLTSTVVHKNSAPIKTLNAWWYLKIGKNLEEQANDERYSAQVNREIEYSNDLVKKVAMKIDKIPSEKLIEPNESIVKPALSAFSAYNSEEELRNMFAKLIASAFNGDMEAFVHPAFVEIIKQLSPVDAHNLELFKGNIKIRFPIARIIHRDSREAGGYVDLRTNLFLASPKYVDQIVQSNSITNLMRLGLLICEYGEWFPLVEYEQFLETSEVNELKNKYGEISLAMSEEDYQNCPLVLYRGAVRLSPLGIAFCKVCF